MFSIYLLTPLLQSFDLVLRGYRSLFLKLYLFIYFIIRPFFLFYFVLTWPLFFFLSPFSLSPFLSFSPCFSSFLIYILSFFPTPFLPSISRYLPSNLRFFFFRFLDLYLFLIISLSSFSSVSHSCLHSSIKFYLLFFIPSFRLYFILFFRYLFLNH